MKCRLFPITGYHQATRINGLKCGNEMASNDEKKDIVD